MIIQTQSKEEIINFDNVMNIEITNCDEDGFGIFAGIVIGIDDNYRLLGHYKSKERAREILEDLIRLYRKNFQVIGERGGVTDFIYPPKVYEMPKE